MNNELKSVMYPDMTDEEINRMHDELEAIEAQEEKLRDEFAKAAITGILAGKWGQLPQYKPEEAFADFAYRVADEMMKRRDRGNPD
jgi:hypothetical protein